MTDSITQIKTPVRLAYTITAGRHRSAFLRAVMEKKLIGGVCPETQKVYVPPVGSSPVSGLPTTTDVEIGQSGIVTTFCIVNIPFEGQKLEPPYVAAAILLDGSDMPIFHLVGGVPADEVRMGTRVKAVWVDDEDLAPTLASIRYFQPTGEEDAPYDDFKEHL
jgi:uncharacterized protein